MRMVVGKSSFPDPVIVPHSVNCFDDKVGKRSDLTKINSVTVGTEGDPGLGCTTSARLLVMRTVVGNSSFYCPYDSRKLCQSIYGMRNNTWICEIASFTNYVINAIYGMRNNNWLLFLIP